MSDADMNVRVRAPPYRRHQLGAGKVFFQAVLVIGRPPFFKTSVPAAVRPLGAASPGSQLHL